jgi:hypothetical protein
VGALTSHGGPSTIAFESFGVRVRVTGDAPEVIERIPSMLPPGALPCQPLTAEESFGVLAESGGSYRFTRGGSPVSTGLDLNFALMLLENQLRIYIGLHAPNRIFVHAGVVARDGRAIVIPGSSFAGKTTLVLALVRAGAVYYSDEFAVIDERGLVHPYAGPLSLRDFGQHQSDHHVERFGGLTGDEPLPIGAVVLTQYRAGAEWRPTRLSPGRGVLAMLANTLAALKRSEEAVRVTTRAIDRAVVLEGERGEADEIARRLLDTVFAYPWGGSVADDAPLPADAGGR